MTAQDHARFAKAVERLKDLIRAKIAEKAQQHTPALLKRQAE